MPANSLDTVVAALRTAHRNRRFMMKVQQRNDRSLESHIRRNYTGWSPDMPEEQREKFNKEVAVILKAARAGQGDPELAHLVGAMDAARAPFDEERAKFERTMKRLARELPVFAWTETVPGIGELGLATIIAETGPLHRYGGPAKVWKRLGFAPYEGLAGSSWRRGAWRPRVLTAEEWVANPFSAERYAFMHQLAQFLWMAQWIGAAKTDSGEGEPDGRYGEIYAARRKATAAAHPDWSKQHLHRDALRIMFKRFLSDLWKEWNDRLGLSSRDAPLTGAEPIASAAGPKLNDAQDADARRAKKQKPARAHVAGGAP